MTDVMPAQAIMDKWRPGSYDWSWDEEEDELDARGELDILANQVQVCGFTEPVLLGDDGRVWDGHHRILVGRMLALDVPYELGHTRPGWQHGSRSSGAILSGDDRYRYRLWRSWGDGERMAWVMLNPSTADAAVDDPTIRRCISFAKREGYDGIEVINLYALRATDPKELIVADDPEGPDNEKHWEEVLHDHSIGMVVAAWGAGLKAQIPSRALSLWSLGGWYCLGKTKSGEPRHPLYIRGDQELVSLI